jgi:hypothetical protein
MFMVHKLKFSFSDAVTFYIFSLQKQAVIAKGWCQLKEQICCVMVPASLLLN